VFGYRLFFVFSAEGVRRLYALPENEASFGLATFTLVFKHKIPLELAIGRRHRPHDLFGNQEVEGYLENLERAVDHELAALGTAGRSRRSRGRAGSATGSASAAGRAPRRRRRATSIASCRCSTGSTRRIVRAPVARAVRDRDRQADRAARDARHRGGDRRDPRRARAHRRAHPATTSSRCGTRGRTRPPASARCRLRAT
jgi:hypothetical protein